MKPRSLSVQYRDNDDGNDPLLVLAKKNEPERVIESDFVLDAVELRAKDPQAFEFLWSMLDLLAERGPPLDGLDS